MAEKKGFCQSMANGASTVVERLVTDLEINGLNPATTWH
jgi:hypothetical protein